MGRQINVEGVAAQASSGGGPRLFEPGWRECSLKQVELRATRRGGKLWNVLVDVPDIGAEVRFNVNVSTPPRDDSPQAGERARMAETIGDREQALIAKAVGWPKDKMFDVEDSLRHCINRTLAIRFDIEEARMAYGPRMQPKGFDKAGRRKVLMEVGEVPAWAQQQREKWLAGRRAAAKRTETREPDPAQHRAAQDWTPPDVDPFAEATAENPIGGPAPEPPPMEEPHWLEGNAADDIPF